MEVEDENNVDDLSEILNNLFKPLDLNCNLKTGTRPKERTTNISWRTKEKEPPRSSLFSKNVSKCDNTNWRSQNTRESNVTNSWRTINDSGPRKWTWQAKKEKENKEFLGADRVNFRTDYKDQLSHSSYRIQNLNDEENIFNVRRPKSRSVHRSQLTLTLQEILKMESEIPEKVIISLVEKIEEFQRIIGGSLSFEDVVLLLRVFDRICSSYFDENRGKLITSIVNAKFHEKILEFLLLLSTQSTVEKNKNIIFWEDPEKFWNNLLIFYENIFEFMPATACDMLPKIVKATILSINDMETYNDFELLTNVKDQLEKFKIKLTTTVEKQSENNVEAEEPPNSFRLLNIYPSVDEITSLEVPFIRPIIKNGAYQSVEHYLDVQFRLLKEDFTASLRNGICTYLKKDNNSEQQFDVRVYENVQFLAPHVIHDRVASLLQYTNIINQKSVEESSKRFIYGSLLCFTSDNFENISFGTVADSHIKYLKRGQIIIDIKEGKVDFNKNYIMVECTVFFEPYYQVLTAMKRIHEDNFPFKDYIIDVTSQTKPPKYITNSTIAHFTEDEYKFKILSPETWPKADQVGLNESQMKAFHTALTQEFCIIQGPPGTGKTYTTLRIVEFLLRNQPELKYNGPIFVICFTNHALDQFLEGILPFTEHLLRIGGQSKSEAMKSYCLQNYRDMLRHRVLRAKASRFGEVCFKEDDYHPDEHKYDFSDYVHFLGNKISSTYFNNMKKLKYYQSLLNSIFTMDGLISIKTLTNFKVINGTSPFYRKSNQYFIEWLLEDTDNVNIENNEDVQEDKDQNEQINDEDIDVNIQRELYGQRNLENLTDVNFNVSNTSNNVFILTPEDCKKEIKNYEQKHMSILLEIEENAEIKELNTTLFTYRKIINTLKEKLRYLTWRLRQFKTLKENDPPVSNVHPTLMKSDDRWNLYKYWLEQLRIKICNKISSMDEEFRQSHSAYQELSQLRDIYIMEKMKVIGMTTTGAARLQKMLKILKCPIVIAEEAAEVLESHIVVSLTEQCQHLILIGDHQQLRPNTAQYNLAIKYNLEISLFERMVQNGIHCQQLNIQHRMRPEFAKLIVPAIYPNLENSESVKMLPKVLGVVNNLFFINHSVFEDNVYNSSSHKNIYEAKYILSLANYFIKQGYKPEEITILTTYKGQMYLLSDERKRMNDTKLNDVRITVVDNFQGEENTIILLSLVRSNREASIGFLKIENRVCVALSRAKEGFFIIGNMNNLERSSKIWPKINKALKDQNAIGENLTLRCQIHSTRTIIRSWEDFEQVPEGGCNVPCNTTMNCTHICKLMCHPYDTKHEEYKCKEKCTKNCPRNHPCPELCFKDCPPCKIPVKTDLPCGHRQSIPCSTEIEEYHCKAKVSAELPCGHTVDKDCYKKPEDVECFYLYEEKLNCGHVVNIECHKRNIVGRTKDLCLEPCTRFRKGCRTLEHICPLLCHEECLPCTELVQKRRETCTHKVRIPCNEEIGDSICREKCRKILSCGHHCPKLCFEDCGNCSVTVTKIIEECGHSVTTQCKNETNIQMCDEQCVKILNCGHSCKKQCNEPCTEECKEFVTYENASGNMVTDFCYLQPKILDVINENNVVSEY